MSGMSKLREVIIGVIGLAGLSGCAEFDHWAKQQQMAAMQEEMEGGIYVSPVPILSQTTTDPSDVQRAVQELRTYLTDQEARIGQLLQIRAELETQIQEVREEVFVPLRARVETFEGRLSKQEAQLVEVTNMFTTSMGPVQERVKVQGQRLDQVDQEIVTLIQSANQDKEVMRTNLGNFREALVGFHSIMNNLETLVYDEEFRATNAEAKLTGLLAEETKQRTQLGTASQQQGTTLAGLKEKINGLSALEQRLVALHGYINEVRRDVGDRLNTLQSQTVSQQNRRTNTIHAQSPSSTRNRLRRDSPVSSVVPSVDTLIVPIPEVEPSTGSVGKNGTGREERVQVRPTKSPTQDRTP